MSQEPTTAERKRDTGPLPQIPMPLPPDPRARRPGPWRWIVLALVLLLAAGAFVLLTRQPDPMQDARPVEVVQEFVAAVEAKDATRMLAQIEPTVGRREIAPEVRAYVEYIEEIRFDDPRYELLDNDGEIAHVHWTATMRYRLRIGEGKAGEQPIDSVVELSKIEGRWYIRSVQLPET